jgi:signal transduction histidine kinase
MDEFNEGVADDEALISQGLEVLQRNSITLSRLVEDLVDISKIAAGTLTLEFEYLDLKQIVVSSVGLGLPICKHLVQAHQGTLSIASDGPGRGTTVKVELPLLASGPSRSIELKEVHAWDAADGRLRVVRERAPS